MGATKENFGVLRECKHCCGSFLAWSVFDVMCADCEDIHNLNNYRNEYYRNAVRMDRFQPNYHTIETADDYAKAQLYYRKNGGA